MADGDKLQAGAGFSAVRPNIRDPLVERLIGPGKAFEIEEVRIAGRAQQVFKGAPRTLAEVCTRALGFGARPMVVHNDRQLTFEEAFARAGSLARALRERFGVARGTKVAVAMSNRPEWIISLLAVTAAGGVAALVNSRGVAEEMLRAIATVDCDLAILDAERAEVIAADLPDPPWPRIVIGADAARLRPGRDADFAALTAGASSQAFEPMAMDPADGAVILFTSGTTGFPKGALLSHGALAWSATLSGVMGALQDLRYEEENGETLPPERRSMVSPAVVLSPFFHLSGIIPVIRAVSVGATIHIMTKWNADIAFDMVEQTGLSRLAFVPTMLWDMLNSPRATPKNLAAIQYMVNGGGPLNPTLVAEIRRRMPKCLIANTYGQTENSAWASSISGQPYLDNPGSCGWACPTIQVCVLREDGTEADIGESGELWVRSAGVMNEYFGDPKATAATLHDGWCASGDIGRVDENGMFTVLDRKKNMVISGGENIYCAEVERVLFDHPAVLEVIAYGVPDARLGERLVTTVVLRPAADVTEDALKAYCRQHLAIYKTPRDIVLTREPLVRTASGKIDRGTFLSRLRAAS
jgi:acyl-CoA synthetase (AMP-forming)/AMP-acid ligase II